MANTIRLLLIEDSPDDVFLLIRHIKRSGYEVDYQLVQSADALRNALETAHWDVVISDYRLPTMDGLQTLQIVKSISPDLPFILVSGTIGEERAVQIMKAGASDYVMKENLTRLPNAIEREMREYYDRIARKNAEAQVNRLTRALSQSASLIVITNTRGIIEYVNDTFVRVTGYTREEAIGQYTNLLKSGHQSDNTYQDLWNTIQTGKEWHGELLNRKKDGTLFWVSMSISAIRSPDGKITDYIAVQEDITERKRLESELQQYTERLEQMVAERTDELVATKEQMEAILVNSSDAMVLATSAGDIVLANPAFYELFGEHVGNTLEDVLSIFHDQKEMRRVADAILNALHEKQDGRRMVRLVGLDGIERDLDFVFAPVRTGDVNAVVISVRDITRIRDLERFKAEFVANAAHDLSNPIASLKTQLYLAKARPSHLDMHLSVLASQVARMERLVGELRMLSQLDRGVIQLELEPLDLNDLITNVIESQQAIAAENRQMLIFHPQPALSKAVADYSKLERVVVNLIGNALHYTPAGGQIIVTTYEDENSVHFVVSDTGIGIEAENLSRIFERFFRTDHARDMSNDGTGLGLSIVKEMVEAHDGQISVESQIGIGTSFDVRLNKVTTAKVPVTRKDQTRK